MTSSSPLSGRMQRRSATQWRRRTCALLAIWLVFSSIRTEAQVLPEVATFHQLYNLGTNRAFQGVSAKIKGVVLCVDPEWNQLYVHDGVDTVYFNPHQFKTIPKTGEAIELTGVTTVLDGAPALTNLNLSVMGPGTIPIPKHLEVAELGMEPGQWVEIIGRVQVAEASSGRLRLSVQGPKQNCTVYVMQPPRNLNFKWLMDRKVRIRGVNASTSKAGTLIHAEVFAPGLESITTLDQPSTDAFAAPVVSIGTLLNRELGSWTNNRIHITGNAASSLPGEYLVVKDPTGTIRTLVTQVDAIKLNERIEVWGFLETTADGPVLAHAFFVKPSFPAQKFPDAESSSVSRLPGPFGVLTNIADIRKLGRAEAAQGLSVQVRGVITFADPDWHTAFIQDSAGAVFFQLDQKAVRSGQWVELTGQTGPGGFVPEVIHSKVQILGTTNLPQALKVDLQELADETLDSFWVEMQGVVRGVDQQWGHARLTVVTRNGRFRALLPGLDDAHPPTHLIDSVVSIQGVCGSDLNALHQLIGITLQVPSLDRIRILDQAPLNPFSIKTSQIAAVSTFDPDHREGRRLKISGVVTLTIPGDGFVLQDLSGGMRVHTKQTNELQLGESVEVLGFPVLGGFSPDLEEASFRISGVAKPVEPRRTTAEEILSHGTNDGLLVRMKARLLQSVPRAARPELVLQDGPIIFVARTPVSTNGVNLSRLKPGSLLELTGICSIQGDDQHAPSGFRLLLRQPEDIKLLERPAWWTDSRVLWVCAGLLLAILIVAAWGGMLSRKNRLLKRAQDELREVNDKLESRVQRRTEDLQREVVVRQRSEEILAEERKLLRALIDNLPIVVFLKEARDLRFVLWNNAGENLFDLPHGELEGKSNYDLFPSEQAERFTADDRRTLLAAELLEIPEETIQTVHFGPRLFRTRKVPLFDASGTATHLLGISEDITERKRAESELEKAQKGLIEISRAAGMAEVATGVLHNVGNVLNSVNVSSSCLMDKIKKSKISNLSRVVELLRKHEADLGAFIAHDPRGKKLPDYLATLTEHLSEEQTETVEELAHLQKNIEHIKDIVAMQQSFAKVSGVTETLKPSDLVEDALRMNASALARHNIQVRTDFEDGPLITVDRHKVLQILVNLICNAKHACNESGLPEKRLSLRVANREGRARILVSDNGIGIPAENLIRIFSHGFTTKKNGHGFGLHSGALAARELGGSLNVHSEGTGKGAIFILELPLEPARNGHA